jgi:hypothetical protein
MKIGIQRNKKQLLEKMKESVEKAAKKRPEDL